MRKALTWGAVFCLLMPAAVSSAQTVDEIVAKMIEAQGGPRVYEGIRDMTVSGTIELVGQGLEGTVTVYKKEPDKRRSDIEIMGMTITSCYDGETAWGTNQQTMVIEEFTGAQAENVKREAMPVAAVLHPDKYGLKHTLKGKETLDGREHFVIERKHEDGFTVVIYVDAETYLPTKSVFTTVGGDGLEHEIEQVQTDYKKVSGLNMAHSTMQWVDGMEYLALTITDVKMNTGIEDALFVMNK
jgi:outer membrane lipoprotein-sorting protein